MTKEDAVDVSSIHAALDEVDRLLDGNERYLAANHAASDVSGFAMDVKVFTGKVDAVLKACVLASSLVEAAFAALPEKAPAPDDLRSARRRMSTATLRAESHVAAVDLLTDALEEKVDAIGTGSAEGVGVATPKRPLH